MDATAGAAAFRHGAAALVAGLAVPALLICACGSSKPAYCAKTSELKSAVSALAHVDLAKEGIAGAEAAVHRVQHSATGVVEAAKSEFPHQTEAIEQAAKEFGESVKAVSQPQKQSSAVAQIPAEIVALGAAVNDFASATKSKCE
jgi:hypothetical protein